MKATKRGYDLEDNRFFAEKELEKLNKAKEEVIYLMNREYKNTVAIEFVANHYLLSKRQRMSLMRVCCTDAEKLSRQEKSLNTNSLGGKNILIDGFNLIIGLEVALSDGGLLKSYDGFYRDMAGLRGTYRTFYKTEEAIYIIFKYLEKLKVANIIFYLDSPVSNSGKLGELIYKVGKDFKTSHTVDIVQNPDVILYDKEYIISSDSVVIDKCISQFNFIKNAFEDGILDIKETMIIKY